MEPIDLVPSGYRFLPTAEELLVDYLANCVAGAPLPGRAVAFADVYGTEPWNLLGSDRQEGYFFAERKPKNSGGSRVDRKMYSTDDDFFASLEQIHASLMSDDTIPASVMFGTNTDSTTVAAASSSSSIDIVECEQTEIIDDNDDFLQRIEALMKSDDTPIDSTMTWWLDP
ncbi:NAC domain-containing protein 104-like [Musa acuminata AAA Group]|uniref:NAC domain-containing protein 104-like n=1 Tax=Musa acuminata AAA Group TaxID=214697 RepID=UPI0031E3612F